MAAVVWERLWNMPVRGMQSAGIGVTPAPAVTADGSTKPFNCFPKALRGRMALASCHGAALDLERRGGELLHAQLCTAGPGRGFFKMWWHQALKPPRPSLLIGSVISCLLGMLQPWGDSPRVSQSLMAIRSFLICAFLAECPWLPFWCEGEALSKHGTGNWELLGSHTIHLGTWASPFNVFCLSFPLYSWEEINTSSVKDSQLIC